MRPRNESDVLDYLAYGSNMLCKRLLRRIATAREPRVARLPGYAVRYHKRGVDLSAKCDLVFVGGDATAFGVIFAIDPAEQAVLDRFENVGAGYHRTSITVLVDDRPLEALTYLADDTHVVEGLRPYDWYRDLVVAGAREHGLPGSYIDAHLDVPASPDPDGERSRREREALEGSRCD
jgi:hypothetical protein